MSLHAPDNADAAQDPGPADNTPVTPLPRTLAARQGAAIRWWGRAPDNLRGSLLMLAALLAFSVMTAAIKAVGTGVPLPQLLVIRQVIMTVLLLPVLLPHFDAVVETRHLGLQLVRGLCSLGSMLCGFTALVHIPLADATALSFSAVLFVTVAAVLILGEQVGRRRWIATLVGFCGVMIMLRPGSGALNPFALLALAGAVFSAGITISVRMLAQRERTETILFYQAVVLVAALLPATIQWWTPPTLREWLLMGLIGTVGTAGQYLITKAYQVGEAAALAPLDFVRLLTAVGIGLLIFGEMPDPITLLGGMVVVGATIYTVNRNAALKAPIPPTSPPA